MLPSGWLAINRAVRQPNKGHQLTSAGSPTPVPGTGGRSRSRQPACNRCHIHCIESRGQPKEEHADARACHVHCKHTHVPVRWAGAGFPGNHTGRSAEARTTTGRRATPYTGTQVGTTSHIVSLLQLTQLRFSGAELKIHRPDAAREVKRTRIRCGATGVERCAERVLPPR